MNARIHNLTSAEIVKLGYYYSGDTVCKYIGLFLDDNPTAS